MKKYDEQGSLLINVLVSMAIVAVVTFISIPNLKQFRLNITLDDAARALAVDIRYAQQLSITNQTTHGVVIYDSLDYYKVVETDAATTTIKTVNLDPNISITDVSGFSGNFISFNSYGSARESGSVEFTHNTSGNSETINIRPSGYVQSQ